MQSTSASFDANAVADMRPISERLLISFDRTLDETADFFTIGSSLIGGPDIIKGTGDVLQEWDFYDYDDYSERVISMEITRQEEIVGSAVLSTADIVLDNHDDFFTPGAGSAIDEYILPRRPMRLYMGFGSETLPQFAGMNDKMPVIDAKAKKASFHCMDFLGTVFEKDVTETVMYEDTRIDVVLDDLFQQAGLLPTQYELDEALTTPRFIWFEKGKNLGNAVRELMVAEMGRVFMDEEGIIRFENRHSFSVDPVMTLSRENHILDIKTRKQDNIINVVEVTGSIREVGANQVIYTLGSSLRVAPGTTETLWATYDNPIYSIDTILPATSATTSTYTTNTEEDGTGASAYGVITLTQNHFATTSKLEFENTGSTTVFITALSVWGEPAEISRSIFVRETDDDSIEDFEEQVLRISSDFIDSEASARTIAQLILRGYSQYQSAHEITIRANPALQVGDPIETDDLSATGLYRITKIVDKLMDFNMVQILSVRQQSDERLFQIEVSSIEGPDIIAP